MRVLFISKPFIIEPLGIMSLSASLKRNGHTVNIITTNENVEEEIKQFNPDILAYSIITGDQGFYDRININLKHHGIFSIVGGPHPTFFPEMLSDSSFDAICIGEGDKAFLNFLNKNLSSVENIYVKCNNIITKSELLPLVDDLNELPFPDRELVFKYLDIKNGPIKHFMAARGCYYSCSYCYNSAYNKMYKGLGECVRWRSVDNVIEEIKNVISISPTKFIYFQDDTFIYNKKWLQEFCIKYDQEIGLPWHCHTRANLVIEEVVKLLKDAGCYSVHIAAEAGNEKVRRELLKRIMSNECIVNACHLFRKYDIKTMLQNILGLPGTTLENDLETLELNIACKPDYSWVSIFQPYPKTWLGEYCQKNGYYSGDFSDIGNSFFDVSPLNLQHKNEIANLQKLFALAVQNPCIYYSGQLRTLIKQPYEKTCGLYTEIYRNLRKKSDKVLYGMEL